MDIIEVNFNLKRENMIKPNNTLDLNDIKKEKKKKAMVKTKSKITK